MDFCRLALYDVVIYADDSGRLALASAFTSTFADSRRFRSMSFEEGGSRIDDLKLIIGRCAFVASLFDQDGIQVRFMNSRVDGNGITSEQAAMNLVSQVKFSGLTVSCSVPISLIDY